MAEVPGSGYKTYFVKPLDKKLRTMTRTIVGQANGMENEFLSVVIQPNGALEVTEKAGGRSWTDLGYFRDCSEIGNPWEHVGVPFDEVVTTLGETARVARVLAGDLVTTYRVELDWELPRGRSADEKRRSSDRVPYKIVNLVTLRKGQPWVEIETTIENNAEDHYLQVSFPTGVKADTTLASTPFDVVEREIKLPDPGKYDEDLQTEHPMDRFVAIEDGKSGVALLNEGLKAYEPHDDDEQTVSLTMLRCFPLRICITNLEMTDYSSQDKGSQCLGTHTFKYGFMPYAGTVDAAGIWQAAERFNHELRVAQIGPSEGGTQALAKSFLEVEQAALHVSAVKQSEDGKGWVVRLAKGHCLHQDRRCHGNVPFMEGLTLSALARYHRITQNPEVLRAMSVGIDQMIRECWQEEAGTFSYTACPLSSRTPYVLFVVSAEAMAYEAKLTGNQEHLRVLRKGLRATIGDDNEFGKSLAQLIFFTPHSLTALER